MLTNGAELQLWPYLLGFCYGGVFLGLGWGNGFVHSNSGLVMGYASPQVLLRWCSLVQHQRAAIDRDLASLKA